jgi:hypothetical protein
MLVFVQRLLISRIHLYFTFSKEEGETMEKHNKSRPFLGKACTASQGSRWLSTR